MPRELMLETATGAFALCPYELPPLQPEDVRIRIELATVKHGTESHAWSGAVNRGRRWDPRLRLFLDPPRDDRDAQGAAVAALPGRASNEAGASATGALPPLVAVGNMAVGVVEQSGAAVADFRPGDRVYGYMPVRETHQAPAADLRLRHLPDRLSSDAAVCVDPAHVAFVAVRDGKVRLDDSVAVFGLGAIGLLTVQAALAAGAERVIAVDPLPGRRERAVRLGAADAFDPTAGDVGVAIKEATEGRGVDVARETSGTDRAMQEAIRCIMQCGTVVAVGWASGPGTALYLGEEFHVNRPTLVASQCASFWGNPDRDYPLWDEPRAQLACAELFCRGSLHAVLDPIVTLDEARCAPCARTRAPCSRWASVSDRTRRRGGWRGSRLEPDRSRPRRDTRDTRRSSDKETRRGSY